MSHVQEGHAAPKAGMPFHFMSRAPRPAGGAGAVIESPAMNERRQSHIDHYLQRLAYRKGRKPAPSTARLLAARDADEAHPLRIEEEAAEVVECLSRLEPRQFEEESRPR